VTQAARPSSRRSPTAGNRGQGGKWIRPESRHRIYQRDGYRCVYCLVQVQRKRADVRTGFALDHDAATLDHVIPRGAPSSTNAPTNLVTACARCGSLSLLTYVRAQHGADADSVLDRVALALGTPP